MSEQIKKVTIIGSGSIGASWAALFLAAGLEVSVYDINAPVETFLRSFVTTALPVIEEIGGLKNKQAQASDIVFTTDLASALQDTDFVQENGPEKLEFKRSLFQEITSHVKPDTIIATSSSGLTCSSIQEGVSIHPERCVVGHPFNPPHLIPLVEVVGGRQTSAQTIDRCMDFYARVGKKPIRVQKEVPGHIANRLQAALMREVLHLMSEDICSIADIDEAMQYGPGLRWGVMGPNALLHLGGGPGGAQHMSDHILGALMTWYAEKDPVVDEKTRAEWVKGTLESVKGKSYENLAFQRDQEVIRLLKIRQEWDGYAKSRAKQ